MDIITKSRVFSTTRLGLLLPYDIRFDIEDIGLEKTRSCLAYCNITKMYTNYNMFTYQVQLFKISQDGYLNQDIVASLESDMKDEDLSLIVLALSYMYGYDDYVELYIKHQPPYEIPAVDAIKSMLSTRRDIIDYKYAKTDLTDYKEKYGYTSMDIISSLIKIGEMIQDGPIF